ncbi:MAG: response regulator [Thermodesulfobacteriota bacterium]
MSRERILYIDDEEINLFNFAATFGEDYQIATATGGEAGLALLEKEGEAAVVLTDQRMPGLSGIDLLFKVQERWPDTVRIVVTAYTDAAALIDAINRGHVYRYVVKPWDADELGFTLANCVNTYRLTKQNRSLLAELEVKNSELLRLNAELEDRVAGRTRELAAANTRLSQSYDQLVAGKYQLEEQQRKLTLINGALTERVRELEAARQEIRRMAEILPICSYCRKIRDDANYWQDLERYLRDHADIAFSHSICPDCYREKVQPELDKLTGLAAGKGEGNGKKE